MDPEFYPVQERLIQGARTSAAAADGDGGGDGDDGDDEPVFLVDVGGGKGHDLQELYRKHPNIPGKLVLQELEDVVEEAKAGGGLEELGITAMAHDFFTAQPILGMPSVFLTSHIPLFSPPSPSSLVFSLWENGKRTLKKKRKESPNNPTTHIKKPPFTVTIITKKKFPP